MRIKLVTRLAVNIERRQEPTAIPGQHPLHRQLNDEELAGRWRPTDDGIAPADWHLSISTIVQ